MMTAPRSSYLAFIPIPMQILSVTLKNFKAHRDKHFSFSSGTNAICGENGAGKTSILEAIAWTLFNYQGDYVRDDLVRNGCGSAEVAVDFISSYDGRTYTVQRHTNQGYTLFDPQLNVRLPYTRIKDEVLPWLREHLGVAPGTDLGELFARTVGVPQGMFTADFLQSPEKRKVVFDKILKVEDYKMLHKDLNSLRRYAEAQVEAVERDISNFETRLTAWEELQQRHQTLVDQLTTNEAQLVRLTQQLDTLEQQQQTIAAQVNQVRQMQDQQQQIQSQLSGKEQAITLLQQSLEQANQAVDICANTQLAYEAYQVAEAKLQVLEQQQVQRQAWQKRQQQLRSTLEIRAADITRLQVQLDRFQAEAREMDQLQPLVNEQTELETQLQDLQRQQTALAQVQGAFQAIDRQAVQLAQTIAQVTQDIQRLQALTITVAAIPALEQQRDRLQQQLSRVEAAKQFEAELQQLVHRGRETCDRYQAQAGTALQTLEVLQHSLPLLSADAMMSLKAALEAGVEVNEGMMTQIGQILHDLSAQTDAEVLRSQLQAQQQQLAELAKHQAAVATLPERQQQLAELQVQQTALSTHRQALQQQLAQSKALETRITNTQTALARLENPRGQCTRLARARQQQPAIQKRYDEMQAAQVGIKKQIEALDTQLQAFSELDDTIAAQHQIKQTNRASYLQYLQYERAAQGKAELTAALAAAQQVLSQWQQERDQIQQSLQAALVNFDPQRAEQIALTYRDLCSQRDRLTGSLPQQRQLLQELQRQINDLKDVAEQRNKAIKERQKRDRIRRFINFARRVYKEAGPRITERYVQQISREGDRLFRELLNRPNVALTWTRDYEIQVQEGPDARRFVNLSGGEQMCAALAVRLALLKVLADIDIAFFDEPTTNMDRPRRESLAEAIARIKSFRQLFVISHDDTFEKVTENVIVVERDND